MQKIKFGFLPKIAVDLGTARTRIWIEEVGLVKDEASCVLFEPKTGKVLAVGDQAIGFQKKNCQLMWPMKAGFVLEKQLAQGLVKSLLAEHWHLRLISQPTIIVSSPACSSTLQRQSLSESFLEIGAREVVTVAQPLAAMFGAGLVKDDSANSFNLHLGAGVGEAVAICAGSVVQQESSFLAGEWLSWQVSALLKREFGLLIGRQVLSKLCQKLTLPTQKVQSVLVEGKDVTNGQLVAKKINLAQFFPLVSTYADHYLAMFRKLIAKINPDLMGESLKKGLLLTGGLANLNGLENYLSVGLNIPVAKVDDCQNAVINGLVYVMKNLKKFKDRDL